MKLDRTSSGILEDFERVRDHLIEGNLILDMQDLIPFQSAEETVLSWARSPSLAYLLDEFSMLQHFRDILHRRDFNMVLGDGSAIQVYYVVRDGEVAAHRLSYFPCPFALDADCLSGGMGIVEYIDENSGDHEFLSNIRLAGPVRFDFDSNFADHLHAHSHLTLNKSSFRMPVYGPLSVGLFFKFVLRYFYHEHHAQSVFPSLHHRQSPRTLSPGGMHELFVERSSRAS